MDTHGTTTGIFAEEQDGAQPQNKMPKQKLKEIIVNAIVIGLLVIAFAFTLFLPSVRYSSQYLGNYSANISPFDFCLVMIDEVKGGERDKLLADFLNNDGSKLLNKDKSNNIVRSDASEKQVLADVEFKRSLSVLNARKWKHVAAMIGCIDKNIENYVKWFLETFKQLGYSGDKLEEMLDKLEEELREEVVALYPVIGLAIDDVTSLNFAGLKRFITTAYTDYAEDGLTAEKFEEYKEKYLISDFSLESLTGLFDDMEDIAFVLPGYADTFTIDGNDANVVALELTSPSDSGEDFVFVIDMILGITLAVVAVFYLCEAVVVLMRLLRIIKDKPRKLPKKRKFITRYPIIYSVAVSIVLIVGSFVLAIIKLGGILAGGFAPLSVLTLLVSICLIAAEVYAMKLAKNDPVPQVQE